jgi:hypothetical protein
MISQHLFTFTTSLRTSRTQLIRILSAQIKSTVDAVNLFEFLPKSKERGVCVRQRSTHIFQIRV